MQAAKKKAEAAKGEDPLLNQSITVPKASTPERREKRPAPATPKQAVERPSKGGTSIPFARRFVQQGIGFQRPPSGKEGLERTAFALGNARLAELAAEPHQANRRIGSGTRDRRGPAALHHRASLLVVDAVASSQPVADENPVRRSIDRVKRPVGPRSGVGSRRPLRDRYRPDRALTTKCCSRDRLVP